MIKGGKFFTISECEATFILTYEVYTVQKDKSALLKTLKIAVPVLPYIAGFNMEYDVFEYTSYAVNQILMIDKAKKIAKKIIENRNVYIKKTTDD